MVRAVSNEINIHLKKFIVVVAHHDVKCPNKIWMCILKIFESISTFVQFWICEVSSALFITVFFLFLWRFFSAIISLFLEISNRIRITNYCKICTCFLALSLVQIPVKIGQQNLSCLTICSLIELHNFSLYTHIVHNLISSNILRPLLAFS